MYSVHQIYTRFTVLAYECLPVSNKAATKSYLTFKSLWMRLNGNGLAFSIMLFQSNKKVLPV